VDGNSRATTQFCRSGQDICGLYSTSLRLVDPDLVPKNTMIHLIVVSIGDDDHTIMLMVDMVDRDRLSLSWSMEHGAWLPILHPSHRLQSPVSRAALTRVPRMTYGAASFQVPPPPPQG
jgi:hypothetical protein